MLADLFADRPVRRLLHRAAVRADPDAQRRRRTARASSPATTSSTRCSWWRQRRWRSPCSRRPHHPAAVPGHGAAERGGRALHLHAGARVPDALHGLDAGAHGVPAGQARARAHPRRGAGGPGLQPRQLRRRAGDRRRLPPADPLRDGPPHLQAAGAVSFVFRTGKAIPIAPAKEDPALLERAYDADREGAATRATWSASFPKGGSRDDGEMCPFRAGIEAHPRARRRCRWCRWRCAGCGDRSSRARAGWR